MQAGLVHLGMHQTRLLSSAARRGAAAATRNAPFIPAQVKSTRLGAVLAQRPHR